MENLPDIISNCIIVKYPGYKIESLFCFYRNIAEKYINNNKVIDINDKVIDINDKVIDINDKVIDINDKVIDINDKVVDINDKVVDINDKVNVNKTDVCNLESILSGYLVKFMGIISQTVKLLHEHGIYHLDLKHENIIITNDTIMLLDFGTSQMINGYKLPYSDAQLYFHRFYKMKNQPHRTIVSMTTESYDFITEVLDKYYIDDIHNLKQIDLSLVYHLPWDFFSIEAIHDDADDNAKVPIFSSEQLKKIAEAFEKIDCYSVGIYMLWHLYNISIVKQWHDMPVIKKTILQILSLIKCNPNQRATLSTF
jgi:hypothetical protein